MPRSRHARSRVTIKDVAREAGVSISTVSNVLNGRMDAMSEETLQRIQKAVASLRFRPNSLARSMVTQRTGSIGLILDEIETPLFLQALSVIEPIARRAGYNVLMCNARNVVDEREALDLLLDKQIDGLIFLSTTELREDEYLLELQVAGLPVVLINRETENIGPYHDLVCWDNVGGVAAAVEHLVRQGHRRIAHLRGPIKRRSSEERLRGYRLGLEKSGLSYDESYVRSGDYTETPEAWAKATDELLALAEPPTAIIASDDVVAAVVMRAIQDAGLRVPADISVVGIDDQPFCTYLNPALATVRLPVVDAGERAIALLLDRIAGEGTAGRRILLPCPLIVRGSCAARQAEQ
ncbi:MAG: LacI family transcriptional regulator [Chloroflexi bacterium]|nr:LacI family transcriptional regulator [Chloroflexota bacterium]